MARHDANQGSLVIEEEQGHFELGCDPSRVDGVSEKFHPPTSASVVCPIDAASCSEECHRMNSRRRRPWAVQDQKSSDPTALQIGSAGIQGKDHPRKQGRQCANQVEGEQGASW